MYLHVCMCLLGPEITLSTAADKRRGKEEEEKEESKVAAGAVASLITKQTTTGLLPYRINAYVFL